MFHYGMNMVNSGLQKPAGDMTNISRKLEKIFIKKNMNKNEFE